MKFVPVFFVTLVVCLAVNNAVPCQARRQEDSQDDMKAYAEYVDNPLPHSHSAMSDQSHAVSVNVDSPS